MGASFSLESDDETVSNEVFDDPPFKEHGHGLADLLTFRDKILCKFVEYATNLEGHLVALLKIKSMLDLQQTMDAVKSLKYKRLSVIKDRVSMQLVSTEPNKTNAILWLENDWILDDIDIVLEIKPVMAVIVLISHKFWPKSDGTHIRKNLWNTLESKGYGVTCRQEFEDASTRAFVWMARAKA